MSESKASTSEVDPASGAAPGGAWRRRRRWALAAAFGLALFVLMRFDLAFHRAYWSLDFPMWLWTLEDIASDAVHDGAIAIGLIAALMCGRRAGVAGAVAILLSFAVTQSLKHSLGRVRPCHGGDGLMFLGFSWEHVAFPSGHTAAVWAIAVVLSRAKPSLRPIALGVAALITWGRLHADAHFVSDLVAGVGVAFLAAEFGWLVSDRVFAARGELKEGRRSRWTRLTDPTPWALALLIPPLTWSMMAPPRNNFVEADCRAMVDALYLQILDRPADDGGIGVYSSRIHSDGLVISVVRDLVESPEFVRETAALEPEQRVRRIYLRMLGRAPSADEMAAGRELTRGGEGEAIRHLIRRIAMTPEFAARYRSGLPNELRTGG